jgi:hypothetical protein
MLWCFLIDLAGLPARITDEGKEYTCCLEINELVHPSPKWRRIVVYDVGGQNKQFRNKLAMWYYSTSTVLEYSKLTNNLRQKGRKAWWWLRIYLAQWNHICPAIVSTIWTSTEMLNRAQDVVDVGESHGKTTKMCDWRTNYIKGRKNMMLNMSMYISLPNTVRL